MYIFYLFFCWLWSFLIKELSSSETELYLKMKKPGVEIFNFLCVCIEKTALQCTHYLLQGTQWAENFHVDNCVASVSHFLKGVTWRFNFSLKNTFLELISLLRTVSCVIHFAQLIILTYKYNLLWPVLEFCKLLVLCNCVTVMEWKAQQGCYKVQYVLTVHVLVYVLYGYLLEFGIYCLK